MLRILVSLCLMFFLLPVAFTTGAAGPLPWAPWAKSEAGASSREQTRVLVIECGMRKAAR